MNVEVVEVGALVGLGDCAGLLEMIGLAFCVELEKVLDELGSSWRCVACWKTCLMSCRSGPDSGFVHH